jgi:hypothetical protein
LKNSLKLTPIFDHGLNGCAQIKTDPAGLIRVHPRDPWLTSEWLAFMTLKTSASLSGLPAILGEHPYGNIAAFYTLGRREIFSPRPRR